MDRVVLRFLLAGGAVALWAWLILDIRVSRAITAGACFVILKAVFWTVAGRRSRRKLRRRLLGERPVVVDVVSDDPADGST